MPLVHDASIVVSVPHAHMTTTASVQTFIAGALGEALVALRNMKGPSSVPTGSLGPDRTWGSHLTPDVTFETRVPGSVTGDAAASINTAVFLANQELDGVKALSPTMVRLYVKREDPRSSFTAMWAVKDDVKYTRVKEDLCRNPSTSDFKLTFLLGGSHAWSATTGGRRRRRSTSRPVSGRKQRQTRSRSAARGSARGTARCVGKTLTGGRCKHLARPGKKTCIAHGRR